MSFEQEHVQDLIPHSVQLISLKAFGLYFMLTNTPWLTFHQGLVSWVCDPCSHTSPCVQKGLTLGLMLYCHHLKIFRILPLNFYFVSKVQWDNGLFTQAKEVGALYMLSYLYCPMSTEFWWIQNVWELNDTQSEFEVRVSCPQLSKQEYRVSKHPMLSVLTRICSKHRKKTMALWQTRTTKEPYRILSYPRYCSVLAKHLRWKWWHRKEKMGQP